MGDTSTLTRAYQLIEDNQLAEARELLAPLLESDADNPDVWWLYAHAVEDPTEGHRALNRVMNLSPSYPGAQDLLAQLPEQESISSIQPLPSRQTSDAPAMPPPGLPGMQQVGTDGIDDFEDFDDAEDFEDDLDDKDIYDDDFDFEDFDDEDFEDDLDDEDAITDGSSGGRGRLMGLVAVLLIAIVAVVAFALLSGSGGGGTTPAEATPEPDDTVVAVQPTRADDDVTATEAPVSTGDVSMTEEPPVETEVVMATEDTSPDPAEEDATATEAPVSTGDVSMTEEPPVETEAMVATEEATSENEETTPDPGSGGGMFSDLYSALPDYEIPENGIGVSQTDLGETLLVTVCVRPGPQAGTAISDVLTALSENLDSNPAEAYGVQINNCEDNVTLRTIAVDEASIQEFASGNIDIRALQSALQPVD